MRLSWMRGRSSSDEIEDIILAEFEVCCTIFYLKRIFSTESNNYFDLDALISFFLCSFFDF